MDWNLIYIDECLYRTYTNPHFWTNLNQTLHTSPPWSGGGHGMDPQYFNFPTFSAYCVGSECRFMCSRWLLAQHSPATALYLWCGTCWCDVTGVTCTVVKALKTRRSEQNACVWKWKPNETGRKWLMDCTCNCVAFIQMITHNLSNLCLSFFRFLSTDNAFFHLLNLSHCSSEMFCLRDDNTVLPTLRVARKRARVCVCVCVCVCVRRLSVYMKPSLTFATCFVLSGKCFTNSMTTLWFILLTWATICYMLEGWKPYKHLHSGSWRENKELQSHFK
jgi:hypothetical protein